MQKRKEGRKEKEEEEGYHFYLPFMYPKMVKSGKARAAR